MLCAYVCKRVCTQPMFYPLSENIERVIDICPKERRESMYVVIALDNDSQGHGTSNEHCHGVVG
jgi:hypothetical protein